MPIEIMSDILSNGKASDDVMAVSIGYDNAKSYYKRHLERTIRNWRAYWAHDPELGLGQWPEEAVQMMLAQKRPLLQFNFLKVIVDTLAGGIMQMPFDPEFYPVNEEITSLTHAIKKAMYSDKEIMNWGAAYFDLVRGGLIGQSDIKIVSDTTYSKLGNIGFKNCLPGSVFWDPHWKSWSSKECNIVWHETWHTKEALIKMFPEMKDFIDYRVRVMNSPGGRPIPEFGPHLGIVPYQNDETQWGSALKLVEEFRMVDTDEVNEYAITEDGEILIPNNIPELDRPAWLNEYHPTWSPDYVFSKTNTVRKCVLQSMVPQISNQMLFADGFTRMQIDRVPFFTWCASRANGEFDSIVDSCYDVQTTINYMESTIIHKMQTDGGGGSQFIDEKGFSSAIEAQRYIDKRNDPTENFKVRPGLIADEGRTPAMPTNKAGIPMEAYNIINHMVQVVLPHISKVTPATRGIEESSNMSGKLYDMMRIQSDQQVFTISYGLRVFWNEVYEAYFMAAATQYSNEGIERKFTFNKGKEHVILNERVRDLNGNVIGIRNDVRKLLEIRHKVIISDQQQSPTQQIDNLNAIGNFIQKLGANSPLVTKQLTAKAVQQIQQLDDEDKEEAKILSEKDMELAVESVDVQILGAKLKRIDLELQLRAKEKEMKDAITQDLGLAPPQNPNGVPESGMSAPEPGAQQMSQQGAPVQPGQSAPIPQQVSPVGAQPQAMPLPNQLITASPQGQGVPQ
jgi:hypothetical protein